MTPGETLRPSADLAAYYVARAAEYEAVYDKPERQHDLGLLRQIVAKCFDGHRVLEVACGTGYWTAQIARKAASVLATDVASETLAIAGSKAYPPGKVEFLQADAFALDRVLGGFDAAFAGFWWSHIHRADIARFLNGLHAKLAPGALVMFLDNRYVAGSSTSIARTDQAGNTYQSRRLSDGSEHEVLKNFPGADDVRRHITVSGGAKVNVIEFEYYWLATYEMSRGSAPGN